MWKWCKGVTAKSTFLVSLYHAVWARWKHSEGCETTHSVHKRLCAFEREEKEIDTGIKAENFIILLCERLRIIFTNNQRIFFLKKKEFSNFISKNFHRSQLRHHRHHNEMFTQPTFFPFFKWVSCDLGIIGDKHLLSCNLWKNANRDFSSLSQSLNSSKPHTHSSVVKPHESQLY